jgi:hypothetical protein
MDCPLVYICLPIGDRNYCLKDREVLPGRCRSDDDCGKCAICSYGTCRAAFICLEVLCESDSDCGVCRACGLGRCELIDDCGPSCRSSRDCAPGEACTFDYQDKLACLPVTPGSFGAACTNPNGNQCSSGTCLTADGISPYYGSYCSNYCFKNGDCPSGYECDMYPPYGIKNRFCVRRDERFFPAACTNLDQCRLRDRSLYCRYGVTPDHTAVASYCGEPNKDGLPTGEGCVDDSVCSSGICADRGVCTRPCEPQDETGYSADCPESYFCLGQTRNLPEVMLTFKGCTSYRYLKGRLGDLCPGGDGDCSSGTCIGGGPGGHLPYCSKECENYTDCGTRFLCVQSGSRKLCLYVPGGPLMTCSSDRDCAPGTQACARIFASPNRIECRTAGAGEGNAGDPCAADTDCKSLICHPDKRCSAVCENSGDCPAGYICNYAQISDGIGGVITYKNCLPEPGTLLPCSSDRDCPAPQACRSGISTLTGEVASRCMTNPAGLKPHRAPCADNMECNSGLCLGWKACAPACGSEDDCLTGAEICGSTPYTASADYARPARACRPPYAPGETGSSCTQHSDCTGQMCFSGIDAGFCTERCRDNTDCLGSLTICRYEDKWGWICTPPDYRPVE